MGERIMRFVSEHAPRLHEMVGTSSPGAGPDDYLLPVDIAAPLARVGAALIALGWFLATFARAQKPGPHVLRAVYDRMITQGQEIDDSYTRGDEDLPDPDPDVDPDMVDTDPGARNHPNPDFPESDQD